MEKKKVNIAYIVLKIIMFVLIAFFATDAIMQYISYSFYKGDRQLKKVAYEPVEIQINESLYGYGYNMDVEDDKVILFFGGSMYIAYNTVGMYGGRFDCPFLSVDYYGTQRSKGKMNLRTMQQAAEELYDYAALEYPGRDIYVFGHSYGCGMAAYLASVDAEGKPEIRALLNLCNPKKYKNPIKLETIVLNNCSFNNCVFNDC